MYRAASPRDALDICIGGKEWFLLLFEASVGY